MHHALIGKNTWTHLTINLDSTQLSSPKLSHSGQRGYAKLAYHAPVAKLDAAKPCHAANASKLLRPHDVSTKNSKRRPYKLAALCKPRVWYRITDRVCNESVIRTASTTTFVPPSYLVGPASPTTALIVHHRASGEEAADTT